MPDDALVVRGLSVSYGGAPVVRGLDLTVRRGQVLSLLGPSGAGKSTLLSAIAGFHSPYAGEIWLEGRCVSSLRVSVPPERRGLAMVFQNYALWPHLSALDTVAYPASRRGEPRRVAREEAMRLLEQLQIGHLAGRRPAELSGGEQQRVGLARALACRADLYLFDEPTAHLDAHLRSLFLEELADRCRSTGAAAIYATHNAEEALGLADRVALMADGQVRQTGTPTEVYREPVDKWAARLTGPASFLADDDGSATVLVRPDWAHLGGVRDGRLEQVWFRGPYTDYLLDTELGRLHIRQQGEPLHRSGTTLQWTLDHSWSLAGRDQVPSIAAGPE